MTHIDVLHKIYLSPTSLASNFVRNNLQKVGALASLGLITTRDSRNSFGRLWRITADGLDLLKEECVI